MPPPAIAYDALVLSHASLIDYWKMDELSGTTAVDSKGSRDGTISTGVRAPTLGTAGIPAGGTSFTFNGDIDHHDSNVSPGSFSVGGSAGVTVEGWFYLPTGRPGRTAQTYGFGDSGTGLYFKLNAGQNIELTASDTVGGHQVTSDGNAPNDTWMHVVGVMPVSGTGHLYVNGVAQSATFASGTPFMLSTPFPFWIGGGSNYAFDATFPIARVAVYNAPLAPATVLAHYNAGILPPSTAGASALLAGYG